MKRSIQQRHRNVHRRITTHDAPAHRLYNALLHSGNKFPGNRAPNNFINKLKARACLLRLHLDDDMTVLAAPTTLLDIFVFVFHRLGNGLFVGHLRFGNIHIQRKLTPHPVNQDFQMQLSHS